MPKAQDVLYAVVGAGDFAAGKVRAARRSVDRDAARRYFEDFVVRGRKAWADVRGAAATKQAAAQTAAARSRVKAATTSVGKAVRANARATRAAAAKTGTSAKSARK
ncbi:MAG TPA: hypothetical protein VHJ34_14650 [Actinomycetota bacterium]|nr:hypothetical protein [Actinomycetota bacterium]